MRCPSPDWGLRDVIGRGPLPVMPARSRPAAGLCRWAWAWLEEEPEFLES